MSRARTPGAPDARRHQVDPASLALAAGLCHALASSGRPLLAWVFMPLLLAALRQASRRDALRSGVLFGAAGGIEIFCAAPYGVLALALMLASHVALCVVQCGALRELGARTRFFAWLAPPLWISLEAAGEAALGRLYAPLPVGFALLAWPPWAQLAATLGLPGLSAAVVAAGALAQPGGRSRVVWLGRAAAIPLALWAYGALCLAGADTPGRLLRVASAQGAVPRWAYESAGLVPAIEGQIWERYASLTRAIPPGEADLVVWPETALRPARARGLDTRAALVALAQQQDSALLVGVAEGETPGETPGKPSGEPSGAVPGAHNRALLVSPEGAIQQGGKRWLIPLLEREWQADQGPIVFTHEGLRIGVLICVESIYPALSEPFRDPPIDLLVIIANDAGLGPGGQQIHALFGALRALELGVPVVHAAQGGASRIFDARGRVLARADPGVALLRATLRVPWQPEAKLRRWRIFDGLRLDLPAG